MISIEVLITRVTGLQRPELERWIVNEWVRAEGGPGQYVFQEIDVARVRLIQELRHDMQVNEEALPVVLSLLDQLYALRRRMRDVAEALERGAPADVRQILVEHLAAGRT